MRSNELLSKLGVSHNTLSLHLEAMAESGEITKKKLTTKERGRPRYVYSVASRSVSQPAPGVNRVTSVVSPGFERLPGTQVREEWLV